MKLKLWTSVALLFLICSPVFAQRIPLERGFESPPDSAKPQVWWHWANGHISKAGITADLEAMKRVGIGGGTICNVATLPEGKVPAFSAAWWEAIQFAIHEAKRLGMEIGIENCEGWSSSGGPWIKPEDSMKMVVWSEAQISGGAVTTPPQPLTQYGYYHDIATLAFRTPASESGPTMAEVKPHVTLGDGSAVDTTILFQGAGDSATLIKAAADKEAADRVVSINFSCDQPFTASSLRFALTQRPPHPNDNGFEWLNPYPVQQIELQSSSDGLSYHSVTSIPVPQDIAWQSHATFPQVSSRWFRLVFKLKPGEDRVGLASINLYGPGPGPDVVQRRDMNDLTSTPGGILGSGRWTILRFGYTTTGAVNHPASPHGIGLECDKLSKTALEHHFAGMMDRVIQEAGPLAGKTLAYSLIDSYEVGAQNWTDGLELEFGKRCGYDLIPWLPALTGRTVESAEMTSRFTHDFQRTIADMFDQNYYGHFAELLHRHGMKGQVEAYGNGSFDSLHSAGLNDMPMSEFWWGNNNDGRLAEEAASAAHTYGRQIVGAESFTANQDWNFTPWNMKIWGDWIFTQGVNRYYFHSSTHQPDVDGGKPGTAWGNGIYLTRNLTWWEPGSAWFHYIARCQYMLQQGRFVADILSFEGEDCYQFQGDGRTFKDPPTGYALDGMDTNTLLNSLSVQNGQLVLPSGMRYRLLVLPNTTAMSPSAIRKLAFLVN